MSGDRETRIGGTGGTGEIGRTGGTGEIGRTGGTGEIGRTGETGRTGRECGGAGYGDVVYGGVARGGMAHGDIAFLLAEAADRVEVGVVPVQAVVRGGRRRRTRRWALTATTAVAFCGATGATLAMAWDPGTDGKRVEPAATQPASPGTHQVDKPLVTTLARGVDLGRQWRVSVEVWDAPRNRKEAENQTTAMAREGLPSTGSVRGDGRVGKTSYFVRWTYGGGRPETIMFDTVGRWDPLRNMEFESAAAPMGGRDGQLVVGQVAKTARQVACSWKDGTSTVVRRASDDPGSGNTIRPAAGTPVDWFVCVAPKGTEMKSVGLN